MLTVYDLVNIFVDESFQEVEIYDVETDAVVFKGTQTDDGFEEYEGSLANGDNKIL